MSSLLVHLAEEMPDLVGEELREHGTLDEPGEKIPDHSDPKAPGPASRAVYAAAQMLEALVDSTLPQIPWQWKWANSYATCFTTKGDSLGQWRGYAGGDGFAIGFSREALSELTVQCWDYSKGDVVSTSDEGWVDYPIPPPQPVWYGNSQRDSMVEDAKHAFSILINQHDAIVPYVEFATEIFTTALKICTFLKEDAFEEESEWRLVASQPAFVSLEFRSGGPGNGGVVPYTKSSYPKEAVSRIIVGPGSAPELRERAIYQMLETYGFGLERVEVVHSTVPFRG